MYFGVPESNSEIPEERMRHDLFGVAIKADSSEDVPIYVSIERTPKQKEAHRNLVTELRRQRGDGESKISIRNDRIVENFQKPAVEKQVK